MPNRLRHTLLGSAWLIASLWPLAGLAAPDRTTVRSNLDHTLEALDSASKEKQKLEQKRSEMDKELSQLQKELVDIAATIQSRERILSSLEENIAELTAKERTLAQDISRHKGEIDTLLMGMSKLSIVPPETVLAMPGDFDNTLRTAKVLGLTSAGIQQKAEALRAQLEEAQRLHARIEEQQEQMTEEQASLRSSRQELEKKLAARGKMQSHLLVEQKANEKAVKKLAADSASLRDLLQDLETRWQEEAKKAQKLAMLPPSKPSPGAVRKSTAPEATPTIPRSTTAPLPAEGKIILSYGEKTEDGETSRGLRIQTRENAAVTAPLNGEVVYTGPFLDYGNLIILRHEGKYHSLLAGLETIQCQTGQKVLRGEPVGKMGNAQKSSRLYVEIRKNNRPIDPIPWLETPKLASR